jgi:hypothetical protein
VPQAGAPAPSAPPAQPTTPAIRSDQQQEDFIGDNEQVRGEYQNWLSQNKQQDTQANRKKFSMDRIQRIMRDKMRQPRSELLDNLRAQASPAELARWKPERPEGLPLTSDAIERGQQTPPTGNQPVPYLNAPGPGSFSSPPPPGMFPRPPDRSIEEQPFTPGPGLRSGDRAPYNTYWPGGNVFDYNPPGEEIKPDFYPANPPPAGPPFNRPAQEVSADPGSIQGRAQRAWENIKSGLGSLRWPGAQPGENFGDFAARSFASGPGRALLGVGGPAGTSTAGIGSPFTARGYPMGNVAKFLEAEHMGASPTELEAISRAALGPRGKFEVPGLFRQEPTSKIGFDMPMEKFGHTGEWPQQGEQLGYQARDIFDNPVQYGLYPKTQTSPIYAQSLTDEQLLKEIASGKPSGTPAGQFGTRERTPGSVLRDPYTLMRAHPSQRPLIENVGAHEGEHEMAFHTDRPAGASIRDEKGNPTVGALGKYFRNIGESAARRTEDTRNMTAQQLSLPENQYAEWMRRNAIDPANLGKEGGDLSRVAPLSNQIEAAGKRQTLTYPFEEKGWIATPEGQEFLKMSPQRQREYIDKVRLFALVRGQHPGVFRGP